MKRELAFDLDKGPARFTLLYEGFILGGNALGGDKSRGRDVMRREAAVLDALDGISTATEVVKGRICERELVGAPRTLLVAQADHELLVKYIEGTPWLVQASRRAVDLLDWLGAAPTIDPSPTE